MNNEIDFECMEPVVDAICKSLEENPEDWESVSRKDDRVISCKNGMLSGYRLCHLDICTKSYITVFNTQTKQGSTPFSKTQSDRIRTSREVGLKNLKIKELKNMQKALLDHIQPERVKMKDAHLYSITDRRVEDHHPLNEQRPSCFPPSAVFLILIGILIIGLTL